MSDVTGRGKRNVVLVIASLAVTLGAVVCAAIWWSLPITEIRVELAHDGKVTVRAENAIATAAEYAGIAWPDDHDEVYDTTVPHVCDARRDEMNLPECRMRFVMDRTTRADALFDLVSLAVRCFVWKVTLEVDGLSVDVLLPRDEGINAIPAMSKPRDLAVVCIRCPTDGAGKWTVTRLELKQVMPVSGYWAWNVHDAKRARAAGTDWPDIERRWHLTEDQLERTVPIDLDSSILDCIDVDDWKDILAIAESRTVTEHDAPGEMAVKGVDGAYLRCDKAAMARAVARMLQRLRGTAPGVSACLLGNTRERVSNR